MSITLRIISGAVGLIVLAATVLLSINLLAMEHDASVLLAGYMGIGGILLGAFLLFYAISGEWRPNLTLRKKAR
jgi:hypothetical protein